MIFLNPIWFFALAAISIPVAIHLWNIRKGKTLKVGSIALITAASQKKAVSRRLSDIVLLLFRCLLVILVAFILAKPLWNRNNDSSKTKGWILIPKVDVKEAYNNFKPKIDSLNKAGFEFHYFDKGLTKEDFNKALADTIRYQDRGALYWTLIGQLNGRIPSSLPVYVFTSNNATHFTGEKPNISLKLFWQTYTPTDSIRRWVEKVWLTNDGNVEIINGVSRPNGTSFVNYRLGSKSAKHDTDFAYKSKSDTIAIAVKNQIQRVFIDTSTWRFSIYTDKNSPDAGYLKAALQSIIQFTKHKAIVKQYADASQIPSKQNWLFWLSTKPVNHQLQSDNLFVYENGKVGHGNSWIEVSSDKKIELYKSISAKDKGFAIWKDGFGNPVLSLENQSGKNLYHFYSRFDPSWSYLVWSDEFPKMLLKLVVDPLTEPDTKNDKRILSDQQIMPVINNEHTISTEKVINHTDLSRYIWLLLAVIFFGERWLAHRSKLVIKNG
ncbi:MAG TPA: BatA domain-containing protein [Mucilaginibacter sp.]